MEHFPSPAVGMGQLEMKTVVAFVTQNDDRSLVATGSKEMGYADWTDLKSVQSPECETDLSRKKINPISL